MKRPLGFTIASLIASWIGASGLAIAAWYSFPNPEGAAQVGLQLPALRAFIGLGGAAAIALSIGLWYVTKWAPRAAAAYGLTWMLMMGSLQVMLGVEAEPWWLVVSPYIVFGVPTYAFYRYVRSRVQRQHRLSNEELKPAAS